MTYLTQYFNRWSGHRPATLFTASPWICSLAVFVLTAFTFVLPVPVSASITDPARILQASAEGLVQVEMDLKFDRGEPPTGVMDFDPGSRINPIHALADVVAQERPLETSGYLVGPRTVVAMDPTLHPRFIRTIRVRSETDSTTARVVGYGTDRWMMILELDRPLEGAKPLTFSPGKPAYTATAYRAEGEMYRELIPFSGRYQQPYGGTWRMTTEHQGIAIATNGQPVGLILSRRIPLDTNWQGSPLEWPKVDADTYATELARVNETVDASFMRVRLSFRSPSNPAGGSRDRFRFAMSSEGVDADVTELDSLAMVFSDRRLLVFAHLKPVTTARLERITVYSPDGSPVSARFITSLEKFGALVIETEEAVGRPIVFDTKPITAWTEQLLYRANLRLRGELRSLDLYHGRIATVRVGPRLDPYPELADVADTDIGYFFSRDVNLVGLPIERRPDPSEEDDPYFGRSSEILPAVLLGKILRNLSEHSDPANVPVAPDEENRLAWLGAELQPLSMELARANLVADQTEDGEYGALVTYVHADSVAHTASIQPGDILLRIESERHPVPINVQLDESSMLRQPFVWDWLDEIPDEHFDRIPTPWPSVENPFIRALTSLGFNTRATLVYVQAGTLKTHDFEINAGPPHYESAPRFKSETLGITLRDLTYEVRRYTQRTSDEPGVVIAGIEPGGRASVAGLKPYEFITHVNDKAIFSVDDFREAISAGGEFRFSVKRMAKGRIVTVRL